MTAFDDPSLTVPPCKSPGTFFARCLDGAVPIQSFFQELIQNLQINANYFKPDQFAKANFLKSLSIQIEEFLNGMILRLTTDRDLVSGAIFRFERPGIYAIKYDLPKEIVVRRFGIRFVIIEHRDLQQWVVTHAFFKTTPKWPESQFTRAQQIAAEVRAGLRNLEEQ